MPGLIQEQFGDAIIETMRAFAKNDLDDAPTYERQLFSHVGDQQLRTVLAETLYGTRWLYKLGLALLVKDEEQLAHVRAQIMDYGAICEGLLGDMICHAITGRHLVGRKYLYENTINLSKPIKWGQNPTSRISRLSFHWHIEVAKEENIIDSPISARLHRLRKERNTVHLRTRTYKAYIGTSKGAFETMLETVNQTRTWKHLHP